MENRNSMVNGGLLIGAVLSFGLMLRHLKIAHDNFDVRLVISVRNAATRNADPTIDNKHKTCKNNLSLAGIYSFIAAISFGCFVYRKWSKQL